MKIDTGSVKKSVPSSDKTKSINIFLNFMSAFLIIILSRLFCNTSFLFFPFYPKTLHYIKILQERKFSKLNSIKNSKTKFFR